MATKQAIADTDSILRVKVGDSAFLTREWATYEEGQRVTVVALIDCSNGDYKRFNARVVLDGDPTDDGFFQRTMPAEYLRRVDGWQFVDINSIREAVSDARQAALNEAKELTDNRQYLQSRGAILGTADKGNGQCRPCEEAEGNEWDRTVKQLRWLVDKVLDRWPDAMTVYITGGFDSAEDKAGYLAGDYEPWLTAWHVDVWKRP